jgi:hypothetical protein
VPGSLDKKGGRRFFILLSKRLHLLQPFLFNKPVTGLTAFFCMYSANGLLKEKKNTDRRHLLAVHVIETEPKTASDP